jgi:hypothetical protein
MNGLNRGWYDILWYVDTLLGNDNKITIGLMAMLWNGRIPITRELQKNRNPTMAQQRMRAFRALLQVG